VALAQAGLLQAVQAALLRVDLLQVLLKKRKKHKLSNFSDS